MANNTIHQERRNKDFDLYRSSQLWDASARMMLLRRASQLRWFSRLVALRNKDLLDRCLWSHERFSFFCLLLDQIDNRHDLIGMTFTNMSACVRAVRSDIVAVRTFESWWLAALVFPMIGQAALETEGATAFFAGKLLLARIRLRRRRRCHRRRILLGNVSCDGRECIVIHPNSAWNTKKTRRSRQNSPRHISDIEIIR